MALRRRFIFSQAIEDASGTLYPGIVYKISETTQAALVTRCEGYVAASQGEDLDAVVDPDNAGTLCFGNGTVGAPAICAVADTNTGIYFPAADQLAIALGGVQKALFTGTNISLAGVSITPTQFGYLGAMNQGLATTANPTFASASLGGSLVFTANYREIRQSGSTALGLGLLGGISSASGAGIGLYGSTHATLAGDMHLTTGGAVSTGDFIFRNHDGTGFGELARLASNGDFIWKNAGGSTGMTWDASAVSNSGGLGIGTTSPADKLHLVGNLYFGTSSQAIYAGGAANLEIKTSTGDLIFSRGLGATELLRLNSTTGDTGGSSSAGSGNQYVELNINGTRYKLLHDGTL